MDVAPLIAKRRAPDNRLKDRNILLQLLDHIEDLIIQLHQRLYTAALQQAEPNVRALILEIQEDRRSIVELCVHNVDHYDPEISLNHDHINNDHTLSLYAQLALATKFGCRDRILFLHQLQCEICERLHELGIDTSQN